jgi:hypothetical protein
LVFRKMRASTHSLPEQEFGQALRLVCGDGEHRRAGTRQGTHAMRVITATQVSSSTDAESKPGLDEPLKQ